MKMCDWLEKCVEMLIVQCWKWVKKGFKRGKWKISRSLAICWRCHDFTVEASGVDTGVYNKSQIYTQKKRNHRCARYVDEVERTDNGKDNGVEVMWLWLC